MASINFLYRSTKNNAPLNVRLLFRTSNGEDKVYGAKSKLIVSKEYWIKIHNQKNTRDINIKNTQIEVTTALNKIENHLLNKFNETDEELINKKWLQNRLNEYYNPTPKIKSYPTTLIEYFDFFLVEKSKTLATQTLKNYSVVKKLLIKFETFKETVITIKDVDLSFKTEFHNFCINEGYAHNTIARALYSVKSICNHAKYNGLETSYQLEKVKIREEKVPNIYLSFKDLEKIEKCNLNTDYLKNSRDWLIISCYIGQRVSDLMKLDKSKIRKESDKFLIEFTQKKTGKIMTVPLHPKVLKILDKRNGDFPHPISDQKYNDYIKIVSKKTGLSEKVEGSKTIETSKGSKKYRKHTGIYEKWELVSSHIGRRSFATNFYGKIPTSYLIYITGHSTEQLFLNYIGKSNKDLALEITNYF